MSAGSLRVVVAGYVVRGPLGGLAWHHLQYVMGLAALGHDVWFVEDSDDYPSCYDPVRSVTGTDPSYGLRFAAGAFEGVGLGDRWAYHDAHSNSWYGPAGGRLPELCRTADLLLNVSGVNPLRSWLTEIDARALIDTDPVFTQVRHLTDEAERARALAHTCFFTFGENFGEPGCSIPDDGLPWQRTRQPVVLDAWPLSEPPPGAPFTTVMQWDSYPAREYGGVRYGMKSESFAVVAELPSRSDATFELALGSENAPGPLLTDLGWRVRDPRIPTRDPWSYQRYLQGSAAELGVAKHGYVVARSGWFAERSAAYLASGRPVVVQDTGFSDWLPSGRGVVAFDSLDSAVEGVRDVMARHREHCRAAREVCGDVFDARRVLVDLLERALPP